MPPRIEIGKRYDRAKLELEASFPSSSNLNLIVGDAHDMAVDEIRIIERNTTELNAELDSLRTIVAQLAAQVGNDPNRGKLVQEARELADTANRVVDERKWYSISVEGLLEAAKAVGEAASPFVASAIKIIELLQKAKR